MSFVTSDLGQTKKSSRYVQKRVEKDPNMLEKFLLHKKCWPRPKDCKKICKKLCDFGGSRKEFIDFWGCFFQFLILKIHISSSEHKNIGKLRNMLTSTSYDILPNFKQK